MNNSESDIQCDLTYSGLTENIKYALQAAYMVPPAILYARMLYVIWVKHEKIYGQHQFFAIYSMDCVVGLLLLLLDIFITRFFVYIPQLCFSGSEFFLSNPIFMEIYYPLLNYLHTSQPLIQIFLTLNRMSSVVWPVDHNRFWRRSLPFIILFILLTPFAVIWNTIISKKILIYYFGGFYINCTKKVPWASMSLFLMVIRSVVVGITLVSTGITFWKMSKMKNRLKKSEKTLCIACAANSVCFMVPAFFEAFKVLNSFWSTYWLAYLLQPFAWDVLNVGSPLVMIFASNQLRGHVLGISKKEKRNSIRSVSVVVSSGTNLTEQNRNLTN